MEVKQRELLFTLVHVSDLSWMQPHGLGLAEDLGLLPSLAKLFHYIASACVTLMAHGMSSSPIAIDSVV